LILLSSTRRACRVSGDDDGVDADFLGFGVDVGWDVGGATSGWSDGVEGSNGGGDGYDIAALMLLTRSSASADAGSRGFGVIDPGVEGGTGASSGVDTFESVAAGSQFSRARIS